MPKLGFVSLGCAKNLVDTEVMLGHLERAGYELTTRPQDAEILVVNTCGFIDRAKQESIDTILDMARYKESGACRRLVVSGCLAQRYAAEIASEIPEIDVVVGLDDIETIAAAVGAEERRIESLTADASSTYLYDHLSPRVRTTASYTAFLKISEGCDYPCSFCIIPKIRGSYRSREPDSILAEAESLARSGVKELVLIAQDTTRYGKELGLATGLADLLRQLAGVTGIEWVRFLYAYPTTVTDDILEALASEPHLCRYLDIPLQHGSDRILKAMKRPGTAESNLRLVERARAAVPDLSLRSSFIVGFPDESDEDVEALLSFCRDAAFDHVGVFTYSNEEGTAARVSREIISKSVKAQRRRKVMVQQRRIATARNQRWVGQRLQVLVEGCSTETDLLLKGRTEGQAPEIDGCVLINEGQAGPGDFVTVEITEAHPYDLVGRIVPGSPSEMTLPASSSAVRAGP